MDGERISGKEKREGGGSRLYGSCQPLCHWRLANCSTNLRSFHPLLPRCATLQIQIHPFVTPGRHDRFSSPSPPPPLWPLSISLSMPPLHLAPFPPYTGIASIDRLSCECRNFWVDDQSGRRADRFFIGIVHLRKFNRIIDATSNGACLHAAVNYSLYFLPTSVHTFHWRFVSRQDTRWVYTRWAIV